MSMRIETQSFPSEEYLHWRDEILQVMYWMSGEGLGETVAPANLVSFLAAEEGVIAMVMARAVEDRFLEMVGVDAYRLTELGKDAGKRSFTLEFEEMTARGHGECSADCWCHRSGSFAAQCSTERIAKVYGG